MAKAVKDHRSKKNPHAHEAWKLRKKAANSANVMKAREQRWFRTDALRTRSYADTITEKNRKEVLALGIELERLDTGKSTPLESGRSERT